MKYVRLIAVTLCCFLSINAVAQNTAIQIYQNTINRNEADRQARLAREAAAAEAQNQRNYEAQQAAERRRQQEIRDAYLPEDSRCIKGSWIVKRTDASTSTGFTLDITNDGKVYFHGMLVNGSPNASLLLLANNTVDLVVVVGNAEGTLRQRLSLVNNQLIGNITRVEIKKGFWGNKELPPETFDVLGERTNQAPEGCINSSENSDNSAVSVRGETIADGLKKLSDLHDQGMLTEEEFNAAKRKLLEL